MSRGKITEQELAPSLKEKIVNNTAGNISILDTDNRYESSDVEGALKESASKLSFVSDKVGNMKTIKSNKDANGVFTTLTYRRKKDDSLFATSVLSGGISPNYTTRTVTYYESNGTTVSEVISYKLTYDSDGTFISEV